MITNERQYKIAHAQMRRFEESLDAHHASEPAEGVDPRIHEAMGSAIASEIEDLAAQIQRYEDLRDGRVDHRELGSLRELPIALIEARIVAGMTQKELAEGLGVAPQQVQRWESTEYSGVGVDRLQEVADALGVRLEESVSFAVPA